MRNTAWSCAAAYVSLGVFAAIELELELSLRLLAIVPRVVGLEVVLEKTHEARPPCFPLVEHVLVIFESGDTDGNI